MSEVVTVVSEPVIVHQGKYRLYHKPDGGLRLQYKRDDSDHEDFIELPAAFVELADKASRGELSLPDMVKAMAGMMRRP